MADAPPPQSDWERQLAEQAALLEGLQAREALAAQAQGHLRTKLNVARAQAELEDARLRRAAAQCQSALVGAAAQADLDLAKNRVDLHRWRQRTALLKVRLSSAHEDVDRYRRFTALLRRQYELEVAAKRGVRGQAAALGGQVAALGARMREQAGVIAGLQADLLRLREVVAERDAEIAEQQAAMVLSSDEAQVALGEARAATARLQEQLAAAQERAALADQTAATAQERANLAEQTLRQREAVLAEKERFQSEVQHFSQDLQKVAAHTSSVVDGKLQAQLAAAQEKLLAEQTRRVEAKGAAKVQQAKVQQVQREVDRLQRSLAARDSLIQQLKTARLTDTPAREVTQTMELVGSLAQDLAGTPGSVMRQRSAAAAAAVEAAAAAAGQKRSKQRQAEGGAGKAAKPAAKSGKQAAGTAAVQQQQQEQPAAVAEGKKKKSGKKAAQVVAPAAERQQVAAPKPAKRAAPLPSGTRSDSSWDDGSDSDGGAADPDFAESPLLGGKAGKAVQQRPAAAEGVRARRERKQAGAFWMGTGAQQEQRQPAALAESGSDEEEADAWAEPAVQQKPQAGKQRQVDKRSPARAEPAAKAAPADKGPSSSRKRKQAAAAAQQEPQRERPGAMAAVDQARDETGDGAQGKASKRQMQSGGSKKVAAKKAAAVDKENAGALNLLSAAAAREQHRREAAAADAAAAPKSRLEERPLVALNDRVVAAATQRQDLGSMPITAQLQRIIAARSAGAGGAAAPQPSKRKLLAVSSTFRLPGDAVPAHMMFGAASKAPRLVPPANENNPSGSILANSNQL